MRNKAEQGIYTSRPPLGYRNNKLLHTIEIEEAKASIARRLFALYATGQQSLNSLRAAIRQVFSASPMYDQNWRLVRKRCGVWIRATNSAARIGPIAGIWRNKGTAKCFRLSWRSSRLACWRKAAKASNC